MVGVVGVIITFLTIMLAGLFAGLIGSMTGLGGGTVLVPLLTLFFGIPIILATGASLISTIATSAGSASAFTRQKIANVKIGIGLEMATTTGAIIGSFTLYFIDRADLLWVIFILFGTVLLLSMIPTIHRSMSELPKDMPPDRTTKFFQLNGKYFDPRLKKEVVYNGVRWFQAEAVMFFAGFVSGLLGIGSGALKVMGMDWAMNLPMKVTTTTSNFMIGLEMATTTGAIIGSFTLYFIDRADLLWVIFILFGTVLLLSMIPTIHRSMSELPKDMPPDRTTKFFQLNGKYYDPRLKQEVEYNGVRWFQAEAVMFFAGFVSGLLGIGSGALKVMGMDWAMNLPMKVTTTTSNFMIGITAATGSSIYWKLGYIQPFLASATAIGVVIGSFFGAKLLMKLTNKEIRWVFFVILSFLGWDMVFRGLSNSPIVYMTIQSQTLYAILLSIVMIAIAYYWIGRSRKIAKVG